MRRALKGLSIVSRGVRYKLTLAFCLMSIIPLLVLVYFAINFVFPRMKSIYDVSLVVILALVTAILGWLLIRRLIEPIVDMAEDAKKIAEGQYHKRIAVEDGDEIGELGKAINLMGEKIRSSVEELKGYGKRTVDINIEIQKSVLALSTLLQISDVISSGKMEFDNMLEFAVEKISQIDENGFSALYMSEGEEEIFRMHLSSDLKKEGLEHLVIRPGEGVLGNVLKTRSPFVIDKTTKDTRDIAAFKKKHNIKNLAALPIYSGNRNYGILLVGNRQSEFRYPEGQLDVISILAKQIAIGIENEQLFKRTEGLDMMDELTSLFNRNYITKRLEDEIRRSVSCSKPCSFVVFRIEDFKRFWDEKGQLAAEDVLRKFAKLVKEKAGHIGKAARIGGDEFALLLPEKNKREAIDIVEEITKSAESTICRSDKAATLRIASAVAENPIDGSTSEEILKKVMTGLNGST